MIACLARAGLYKRLVAIGLVCMGALAGCSPQYNWREWVADDGTVQAFFPARTQSERRMVNLPEAELDYRMTVATVDDAMFAVAQAALPAADRGDSQRSAAIARAVGRGVYASLQAPLPETILIDGTPMIVKGQGERAASWAMVRVWATPQAIVEAIALGHVDALPAERAREFVSQVVIRADTVSASSP